MEKEETIRKKNRGADGRYREKTARGKQNKEENRRQFFTSFLKRSLGTCGSEFESIFLEGSIFPPSRASASRPTGCNYTHTHVSNCAVLTARRPAPATRTSRKRKHGFADFLLKAPQRTEFQRNFRISRFNEICR